MLVLLGGKGFIGRHICELAQTEKLLTAVISRSAPNKSIDQFESGITYLQSGGSDSLKALTNAKTVVFLASNSKPATGNDKLAESILETTDVLMSFVETLFEINPDCHLIYLSSGGQIYGPNHSKPIAETAQLNPTTPYALSKSYAESYLTYFANTQSVKISILRLGNPIGHWQVGTSHGFVSYAIAAAISGKPLTIFGDGENLRDYFDVDEFAQFICQLHRHENPIPGIFNIGRGLGYCENDIVQLIQETLKVKIDLRYAAPRDFDLRYSVLNIEKAKTTLAWNPEITIPESIQKIADLIVKKMKP